jgi:hypothetical protein
VGEVYLQRMTFGFESALPAEHKPVLATAEQSIFHEVQAEAEAIVAEAERRAAAQGVRFRGADALSPRESLIERPAESEPWRACSRPLRLAYVTAQGTALPCCIAPFTDAPFESLRLGNYLKDGVAAVWTGEAYRAFRDRLYSSTPPPACRNCGVAWSL